MLLKLIIITAILVGFLVLAMGIRLLLEPGSEFVSHSCSSEPEKPGETGTCSACQIRDIANCNEAK
ncbi:MAG: hypothetical protein ACWGNV_18375 [Bacteroidales bacterium]